MNIAVADFITQATAVHAVEPVSRAEALTAQRAWADMVTAIGASRSDEVDTKTLAQDLIAETYEFENGMVLLKPAYASGYPVRKSFDEVVSYYVGGHIWEDQGFALRPWRKIRFGKQFECFAETSATLMGACYLTPYHSAIETRLDFTMGFRRGPDGVVRLALHHVSVPFRPVRSGQIAA